MTTENEHIEALRKRLLARKQEIESKHRQEIAEVEEMIRVLGDAPKVLAGTIAHAERQEQRQHIPGTRYNTTFSKDVEDYVAGWPYDNILRVSVMLENLRKEKGLQGKPRSLSAYAHKILSRLVESGKLNLKHGAEGYYRTRKPESDSTLVHSA
jgi:hypothetical protein